jgi:hypothetical protein
MNRKHGEVVKLHISAVAAPSTKGVLYIFRQANLTVFTKEFKDILPSPALFKCTLNGDLGDFVGVCPVTSCQFSELSDSEKQDWSHTRGGHDLECRGEVKLGESLIFRRLNQAQGSAGEPIEFFLAPLAQLQDAGVGEWAKAI